MSIITECGNPPFLLSLQFHIGSKTLYKKSQEKKNTAISCHVEGGFVSHVNMWDSLCWFFQNRMYSMNHIFIIFHFMIFWADIKLLYSGGQLLRINVECTFMTCGGCCASYVLHCTVCASRTTNQLAVCASVCIF